MRDHHGRGAGSHGALLSLDHVIEHAGLPWRPTEAERVAAFEALGINRWLLPFPGHWGGGNALERSEDCGAAIGRYGMGCQKGRDGVPEEPGSLGGLKPIADRIRRMLPFGSPKHVEQHDRTRRNGGEA